MAAFLATYVTAGWHFGSAFPAGPLFLAASGAAFTAVVLGQMGTALACRSTTRWVGNLRWSSNLLLLLAILIELITLVIFLTFRPVAQMLGHSVPNVIGLLVALIALPGVIVTDLVHKRMRARRRSRISPGQEPLGT